MHTALMKTLSALVLCLYTASSTMETATSTGLSVLATSVDMSKVKVLKDEDTCQGRRGATTVCGRELSRKSAWLWDEGKPSREWRGIYIVRLAGLQLVFIL